MILSTSPKSHALFLVQTLHAALQWNQPKEVVVDQVHLPSSIVVAEPIALSREVQPLWMTKLVTNEVEVGLST